MTSRIPSPTRPAGIAIAAVVAVLGLTAPASAHVEVLPASVTSGEATEFTIRVPNERDLPTVAVRLDIPSQMIAYSFENPPPGFTVSPRLAGDGRVAGVTWRGRIPPGRYQDFTLLATPLEEGAATWKARQTYADGKVKPWTGPPEAPGEASSESGPTEPGAAASVEIVAAGATPPADGGASGGGAASSDDESGAGIWLGLIGIALAIGGLVGVGLLWSTRPVDLPEDESP
jgi:uncharacterized protein YcnI